MIERKIHGGRRRRKKERRVCLETFFSLRHRFPLSRSPFVLLFQPVQRTAGSRHFPTKSSREDFLLIDVETPERWERAEEHKGRKEGRRMAGGWRERGRRKREMGAGKKNDEYREKQEGTSLLERPKHLRVGRVGSRLRGKHRDSPARKLEKSIWLWRNATRQVLHVPRSYPRFALYFAPLRLYTSHLFRSFSPSYSLSPLIRRNFHRKFSRQAQSATPEAAVRGGSECNVVFISAPNEFAGRSSYTHTLIAATPRHAATQRIRLDGARNGAARRGAARRPSDGRLASRSRKRSSSFRFPRGRNRYIRANWLFGIFAARRFSFFRESFTPCELKG